MNRVGRTRVKLAKLLNKATGLNFLPSNIYPVTGWYRTSRSWRNDSFRWSAVAENKRVFDSYSRMTDCVQYGIEIHDREVFAKEATTK